MKYLEKFENIPVDKQNAIIDAALKSFGNNGYKKTSVSDIAKAAGISKSMIFYYFGTKKGLYLYLVNLCGNIIINEFNERFDYSISDFFDRIKLAASIKTAAMKKHSSIPSFLTSMYFENDSEVKDDIKEILAKGEDFKNKIVISDNDYSKFKDGINPELVLKMLTWLAEGYASRLSGHDNIDYDAFFKEFEECLDLLKNNLYK